MNGTRSCISNVWGERPRAFPFGWTRLGSLVLALAAGLALLLGASVAQAGSFQVKNPRPEEVDGRWKLAFSFNYGKKPHMAHIPMMFSFKHVRQYIWAYTEQSPKKPVFQQKPLTNRPEINIPVDVGFADMKGEIHKITRFKIELRRDREFEAGEYQLTVRQEGRTYGRPVRITLRGKNKPIDRRPIEFKAKPIEGPKKPKAGGGSDEEESDPTKGHDMGDVMATDEELAQIEDEEAAEGPPPEKPKQGGCGCRVEARHPVRDAVGLSALLMGMGLLGLRRRRR